MALGLEMKQRKWIKAFRTLFGTTLTRKMVRRLPFEYCITYRVIELPEELQDLVAAALMEDAKVDAKNAN